MLGIIILKQETPDSNPTHRLFVILIWSPYLRQLHILNDLDYKLKLLFLVYVSKLNTLQAEVIIPFLSLSLLLLATWRIVFSRPLFVYFRSIHIPIQMTNIQYKLKKALMVCLGLEPGAAGLKVQTNAVSYGGTPRRIVIPNCAIPTTRRQTFKMNGQL